MKLERLSYKTLFTIFFFAIAGIIFFLKIGGKTTKVSATWWDNSWNYRKMISVTNNSGIGQSNVLVRILGSYDLSSLVSASKLQTDLDDIRFTDDNQTPISYWIEDSTNTNADIWVIVPSLPTSGTTIWMYYGNTSATGIGISTPFSYTGTNQIVYNTKGQLKMKLNGSGTFVSTVNMFIDAFLVGGGGGSVATANGGGAGGGYTTTGIGISLSIGTSYSATVGSGGTTGNRGGTTQFVSLSAAGGYTNSGSNGGNGGSGGGYGGPYYSAGGYYCCAGSGASNGAGAGGNCASGGSGQGTTTREFGEASGTLYAGGGGGYGGGNSACGSNWMAGGAGGGGAAGNNGTTNTGGGAGANGYIGGSGIIVVRPSSPNNASINIYEESNSTTSENPWWNTNWRYRRTISVPNPSGVNQTGIIVKVLSNYDLSTLITDGKLNSNLSDIRFTDNNGNSLTYWIQDSTSNSVDVWIIISTLASSGSDVWMYYGNSAATSESTPLYSYTGSDQFIDDGNSQFRVKFLSSGTLATVTSSTFDAFLVGGGGGSNYGGAGGGRTTTQLDISISNSSVYPVVVGLGGSGCTTIWTTAGQTGQTSSAFGLTAAGGNGSAAYSTAGANGGSGGGSMRSPGYNGGSDGASATSGGTGQLTTTREFGEAGGALYAGGGGGGENNNTAEPGLGGAGGGGKGGRRYSYAPTAGTANTGGGAGGGNASYKGAQGGSGIVIIRYNAFSISTTINNDEEYLPPPVSNCVVEESPNDTQLTVKWVDNSTNEEGFIIQKSINGSDWTTLQDNAANTTSYVDALISSGNTYQYRISPHVSQQAYSFWCYTSVLNLGQGNFNFEGLNLEGVNVD